MISIQQVAAWIRQNAIFSAGGAKDGGKLILLNQVGKVDSTMLDLSAYALAAAYVPLVGSTYRIHMLTPPDIGSTQTLNLDFTRAQAGRSYIVQINAALARTSATGNWASIHGSLSMSTNSGGNGFVRSNGLTFASSGTVTGAVTAIADGVRVSISSTGFGNTLVTNRIVIVISGENAAALTVAASVT